MKHFRPQLQPALYTRDPIGHRLILLSIVILLISCATVPHTGRRQLNAVSDEQINKLSLKAFTEVISKEPELKDERMHALVKRVADRVIASAEAMDKPKFAWDVRIVDRDIPNAFCLPGGKIVLFSGILPLLENEAGVAAVVAHEIAHAVARHSAERLTQQLAIRGAVSLGGEVLKDENGKLSDKAKLLLGALGMGGTVGVVLPYSRLHEFEADRIGQLYMAKAGYDPAEAARLWERMGKVNKPPVPVWLSTHPPHEDRQAKLREFLPEAQKLYDASTQKSGQGAKL